MTELSLFYVTTKDTAQARQIALALLERRLIACANLIPQMESIYRWEGRIENANECVLLLKTRKSLGEAVIEAVTELHSYETPCVIEVPIGKGATSYLKWIVSETTPLEELR